MSDITDRDRRAARQWAEDIAETFKYDDETPRETRAAVNYILATVEPPASTLVEELRDIASNWGELTATSAHSRLYNTALLVKKMEKELAEAKKERDHFWREVENVRNWKEKLLNERDEAVQQVKDISNREADLEARLASLRSQSVSVTPSVSLTDNITEPSKVPSEEPWLISVRGRKAVATRDDTDDAWQWSVAFFDGGIDDENDESVTLISRLVPAPRVITDPDELDKLAFNSAIVDAAFDVWQKSWETNLWASTRWTTSDGEPSMWCADRLCDEDHPVTVLWEPEVTE